MHDRSIIKMDYLYGIIYNFNHLNLDDYSSEEDKTYFIGEVVRMDPDQIRFTQDSISRKFSGR